MLESAPPEVDFSCPCHVAEPATVGAVAPSPALQEPPEVAPYVIVSVCALVSVTAETLIVLPEKLIVFEPEPPDAVVQPIAFDVVGAVQPDGTATSTSPLERPPATGVYVNTIVFPVDPAVTVDVGVVNVPVPSAAFVTVTDGDEAMEVSVPPLLFICTVHVADPDCPADGATAAPAELTDVSPYRNATVAPPLSAELTVNVIV